MKLVWPGWFNFYLVIYLLWPHQFRRNRCGHKDLADTHEQTINLVEDKNEKNRKRFEPGSRTVVCHACIYWAMPQHGSQYANGTVLCVPEKNT